MFKNQENLISKHLKILVVDDDTNILRMIQRILELEGFEVMTASDGESALEIFNKTAFSLVLLDIMMPGTNGLTVCKTIRRTSNIPIIIVTAKGNINEKLQGFDAGADDYVTKPFPTKELVARVNAVLRRSIFPDTKFKSPVIKIKNLEIDFEQKVARIKGKLLDLTATEYRLLTFLANNPGKIITPESILEEVWGEEYKDDIHLLQVNIGRLRQKLKAIDHTIKYVETKPGQGYLLNPDAE
jgi:DNA-binding response OmpR family regulator